MWVCAIAAIHTSSALEEISDSTGIHPKLNAYNYLLDTISVLDSHSEFPSYINDLGGHVLEFMESMNIPLFQAFIL